MLPSKLDFENALILRHGKETQEKFANSTVAICGLGGLGSNIAIALARAGIGKLILIDFDKVELVNLHRQQYKPSQIGKFKTEAMAEILREISPYIELEIHNVVITEENIVTLLQNADVVCEAFDNPENKAMLTNIVLSEMSGKFLVAASGLAGLYDPNTTRTRRVSRFFYICGDGESGVGKGVPLFSTGVMLCAAHQAHTILRLINDDV